MARSWLRAMPLFGSDARSHQQSPVYWNRAQNSQSIPHIHWKVFSEDCNVDDIICFLWETSIPNIIRARFPVYQIYRKYNKSLEEKEYWWKKESFFSLSYRDSCCIHVTSHEHFSLVKATARFSIFSFDFSLFVCEIDVLYFLPFILD